MSDSPEELLARVAAMKRQLKNFRILGTDGVTIHGNMQHGYAVDTGEGGEGGGGGGGGGGDGGGGDVPGCTDPEATNFNPDATVDDGSCEYATACPGATLVCDSVNFTHGPCGRRPYGGTPTPCNPYGCLTINCDGSYSAPAGPGDFSFYQYYRTQTWDCCDVVNSGSSTWPRPDCVEEVTGDSYCTCTSGGCSASLSDLYTKAELLEDTIASLPMFDGVFEEICGATLSFNSFAENCTVYRYQYKFVFSSPAIAGMSVDWDQDGPDGTVHLTWMATGGETETSVYEEDEPVAEGTTNTINVIVTCV